MKKKKKSKTSSKKSSSINAKILQKLEKNELVIEKLSKEVEQIRRKDSGTENHEEQASAEESLRKKDNEVKLLVHRYGQTKRNNQALLNAFSKIKQENISLLETTQDLRKRLEQTAGENKELRESLSEVRETAQDSEAKEEEAEEESRKIEQEAELFRIDSESRRRDLSIRLLSADKKTKKLSDEVRKSEDEINLLKNENKKLKESSFGKEEEDVLLAEKEKENKLLVEENEKIKLSLLEKLNELKKLKEDMDKESDDRILLVGKIGKLKQSIASFEGRLPTEEDENKINLLKEKLNELEEAKKEVAVEMFKEKRKFDDAEKKMKLQVALIEKLKKEISELKTGYLNELHNRKIIEEYAEKIDSLRRQVIDANNSLHKKQEAVSVLEEEKKILKQELEIEIKSHDPSDLMENIEVLKRENDELRLLTQQGKAENARNKEYYTKLIGMQKQETENRFKNIAEQAAEREVELNTVIEELNKTMEEKNKKIGQQKEFYLDIQKRIRQNILESGMLKEEKKKTAERKEILDFILKKSLSKLPTKRPEAETVAEKPVEAAEVKAETEKAPEARETTKIIGAEKIELPPTPVTPGIKLAGKPVERDRTDEITQIVNMARQHGDNDEQIKASLSNSGYKKEEIDRAFS